MQEETGPRNNPIGTGSGSGTPVFDVGGNPAAKERTLLDRIAFLEGQVKALMERYEVKPEFVEKTSRRLSEIRSAIGLP